jgi:hypothetical protein
MSQFQMEFFGCAFVLIFVFGLTVGVLMGWVAS